MAVSRVWHGVPGLAAILLIVALCPSTPATSGNCLLYTNGDPDGIDAYPNGVVEVFGARRTLLDDFLVPFGETWIVDGLHHLHSWDTLPPGSGTGMEITLRADAGGRPGSVITTVTVTAYMEMATGRVFFGRDEAQSWTSFAPVELPPGRFWFDATVVGPEPNFWLTAPLRNEECWVDYDDGGGLIAGSQQFGVASDLAWCLSGQTIFDPSGACCLPDGSCLEDLPAGACTDGLLGLFHEGQACADVTCVPYGACCLLDGSCLSFAGEQDCLAAGGDYRDGAHCSLVACQVRGACCLDNGTCEEISANACVVAGGDYRGDGARCKEAGCPPGGGCCLPDGTCVFVIETLCTGANGDYQGAGIGCGITECPVAACCRPDGTCIVVTEPACTREGGVWRAEGTDCADFNGNEIADVCESIGACRSDTNDDGEVDFLDILTLITDWGPCAESARGERRVLIASGRCALYENGDPDGINGYSNATAEAIGARRTLLDDFVVRTGETWRIDTLHHHHLWNTLEPGTGTGMEITLWSDADGEPGEAELDLLVTGYVEVGTGREYFERQEAESWTTFDPVLLGPGRYWFEAVTVGPEGNFWLTAPQMNEECWVNYSDFSGLERGTEQFGVPSDLSWCLSGEILFDETGACCLADGSCVEDVGTSVCTFDLHGIFHANQACGIVTCTPFGACCLLGGVCLDAVDVDDCAAQRGTSHEGERCQDVVCPVRGACCFADESCQELSEPDCVDAAGDYQGDGIPCDDLECPETGACCLPAGVCVVLTEFECAVANGDYQGDLVGCGITDCPTGACCRADGTCIVWTEEACARDGGIWRGEETDCADFNGNGIPDTCETIGTCRSDSNDDGVVDFLDLLTMLSDWGPCEESP